MTEQRKYTIEAGTVFEGNASLPNRNGDSFDMETLRRASARINDSTDQIASVAVSNFSEAAERAGSSIEKVDRRLRQLADRIAKDQERILINCISDRIDSDSTIPEEDQSEKRRRKLKVDRAKKLRKE